MINVETLLEQRFPQWRQQPPRYSSPLVKVLKLLFHEQRFAKFASDYPHLTGLDFVDQVLRYFEFSYSVRSNEKERIPVDGSLVIVASHPIGSLDGLTLLQLISEVRRDVKVVSNQLLQELKPLRSLLLPVDNLSWKTSRRSLQAVHAHLQAGGALIIFPAGKVSGLGAKGIRDGKWRSGFLRIARRHQATLLPVYVDARNSAFFYSLLFLARPLARLWLVREMFKQARNNVTVRIGQGVSPQQYQALEMPLEKQVKCFKKQVYALHRERPRNLFPQALPPLAHPENRQLLRHEIRRCELLGRTADNKQISLYRYAGDTTIMRELGRLREQAFRAVGEGVGERRDIDQYDIYYDHLLVWDEEDLEIAGAYRVVDAAKALAINPQRGLYSQTLFHYEPGMQDYWPQALELGRSFVQPRYWGRRSLDYLWYGIGAYLRTNPKYRWLLGPVSISKRYPVAAIDLLVCFYSHYFSSPETLAVAGSPYRTSYRKLADFNLPFTATDYTQDFKLLKEHLRSMALEVPTLYKQYTEITQKGGAQFLAFHVDADFGHCVDGLLLSDLTRLKAEKRQRYLDAGSLNGCQQAST